MTTRHQYDPQCPHCLPALLNTETGMVYPREHPLMVQIFKYWHSTPFVQRAAYIAATVDSSTDPNDLRNARPVIDAIRAIVQRAESN